MSVRRFAKTPAGRHQRVMILAVAVRSPARPKYCRTKHGVAARTIVCLRNGLPHFRAAHKSLDFIYFIFVIIIFNETNTAAMTLADLDVNKVYTYADYLKWQFEERVELILGIL